MLGCRVGQAAVDHGHVDALVLDLGHRLGQRGRLQRQDHQRVHLVHYQEVLHLSEELNNNCTEYSTFINGANAPDIPTIHRNMLDFLVRRFHIPLHCPFAIKARANPLFLYSVKVSLDTAMALMSPQPDRSFFRLMTMGGGIFKEGYRFARVMRIPDGTAEIQRRTIARQLLAGRTEL